MSIVDGAKLGLAPAAVLVAAAPNRRGAGIPARGQQLPRQRVAEASLRLLVDRPGIFTLEAFIDGLAFLTPLEHARVKLAGGEIFDNLIRHAAPLLEDSAIIRVARRGRIIYLAFYFKSPSFASYAERYVDHEPIFDHLARRWHGMGLRMCRNLSSSLTLRAGEVFDRIIIRF